VPAEIQHPFPAPFDRFETIIRPEWIDANGHMNLAYYVVVFDLATAALFDALGIEPLDDENKRFGIFAAETHTLYEREVREGERVRVASQLVGADVKRLHVVHEMFHVEGGRRLAMQEIMFLHVDLSLRRVVPFPSASQSAIGAGIAAHAALARPAGIGRRIAAIGD